MAEGGMDDVTFLKTVQKLLQNKTGGDALREFLREDFNAFMSVQDQELGAFLLNQGFLAVRQCEDGSWIGMQRMGYNYRLSTGLTHTGIEDNYCYDHRDVCYNAFLAFEPGRDRDPVGWKKHVETNRCRPNGDPALESIGWPWPAL